MDKNAMILIPSTLNWAHAAAFLCYIKPLEIMENIYNNDWKTSLASSMEPEAPRAKRTASRVLNPVTLIFLLFPQTYGLELIVSFWRICFSPISQASVGG